MGCLIFKHRCWHDNDKRNNCVKSVRPIFEGNFTVSKKYKANVKNVPNFTFGEAILFMRIWACYTMKNSLSFKILICSLIFSTPIKMEGLYSNIILCLNEFMKVNKDIINWTFIFKKEYPCESRKVINKVNKIFVTNIWQS